MYIDIRTKEGRDRVDDILSMHGHWSERIDQFVVVSGYFDPIHKGHIEYITKASELGLVILILNTDEQAIIKKGKPFMKFDDRLAITEALRAVFLVVPSIDTDGTVCETLRFLDPDYFAKGGDRFATEIPEAKVCRELDIEMVDGLGQKIQSSSWIVADSKLMPDC